jgi:hypothetical protein
MKQNGNKRVLTNEDVSKYEPMIESFIRDSCVKNWNEATTNKNRGDVTLGNSGLTVNDIRQYLRTELCVVLRNFNPDYRTKDGKTVKESTLVYRHLSNRIGGLMKRLTGKKFGYGIWHSQIESTLWETDRE